MNLLVTGAGSIGIALAAILKHAGQSVSIYATGKTMEAIRNDGIYKTGLFGYLDYPADAFQLADDYGKFAPDSFDYILICAKTMANDAVSQALAEHREILKPDGKLVLFQNGWGNDLPYLRYFDQEQICSARVITGFQRLQPNFSKITVYTLPLLLGNLYGLPIDCLKPLAQAISDGGLPCEVTEDVGKALWAKMLYNCALNPLGAILGVHYGALTESPHTRAIVDATIDEIYAVMSAAGYSTYWPTAEDYRRELYDNLLPDTYQHQSSTLQDIRAKRPTEIDTLTGRIVALAEEHGVAAPVNTMLYRLVKSIEANYNLSTQENSASGC